MKLIVVGGGSFLLALGLSTYLGMQQTPANPAEAVSGISADSAHAPAEDPAPGEDLAPTDSAADTLEPAPDHPLASESASAPPTQTGATIPASDAPATTVVQDPPEKQVGRILAQMKPADAAGILTFLGDEEVDRILCHLGVRQAAALLEQIPAERAATLTRSALRRGAQGCTP